ncbi:flagellar biosynthesis protein FlhF [Candidatus Methylomirabilis sp.]|uniref:flagellar biosynthesis protein FlhF n=1 Tax=Candidatus Methylomirabilis sp. TaxID=2032687 RepID=UPI002A61D069|nr:flagellar biosynthesis protein FlhF [Candidatus Methylomirabilis sp.]
MHLKRFRAATMDEALRQVREELGPEAVILHTKSIPRDGLTPFGKYQTVEVVAALDDDPPGQGPRAKGQGRGARYAPPSIPPTHPEGTRGEGQGGGAKGVGPMPTGGALEPATLHREIAQLKAMVSGLLGRGHLPPDLPDALGQIYWSLLAQEVDEGVARRWIVCVRDKLRAQASAATTSSSASLAEVLAQEIMRAWTPRMGNGQRRVVALVGPTGVGKTTTIAKLAAGCHFREGKKVSLITTDTYRIAGAQQLKNYADLIGLPYCVAPLPDDLSRALAAERDADVVFVDTVGRSARRQDQLEELAAYVRGYDGCEVHLVLSATTKRADLLQAIEGYRPLSFSSIIATKIDETSTVGPVLEAALVAATPISYLTTGQEVPDDIEEANPLRLAWRLVGAPEGGREG